METWWRDAIPQAPAPGALLRLNLHALPCAALARASVNKIYEMRRATCVRQAWSSARLSCLVLPCHGLLRQPTRNKCNATRHARAAGLDISPSMLDVAAEREVEGDLALHDMGHGLPLRPGSFDGAISISAVQWLCNADKSCNDPRKRLRRFFESLYAALRRGARAVLQVRRSSNWLLQRLAISCGCYERKLRAWLQLGTALSECMRW